MPQLKVVCWNIHIGRDDADRPTLREQAQAIASWYPDIVLLQEVDLNTRRSGNVDQLVRLALGTGMPDRFYAADRDFDGGKYGNGILSRYPLYGPAHYPYPAWKREEMGLQHCWTQINGVRWDILNTHWSTWGDEIVVSSDFVVDFLRRLGPNVIMGGDLNATDDDAAVTPLLGDGRLRRAWRVLNPDAPPGEGGIDYILYRGDLLVRSYEISISAGVLSDHAPHIATFDVMTIEAGSGPAVCSLAPASDRMDVFVGQNFALWWRIFDGQNWLPWESLGGGLTSDPAVMVLGGAAFVFARGTDSAIYWQWIRSSTDRSGWQRLEGILASSAPAVCSLAPTSDRMDIFVRGQDFALWWRIFDGQNWLPWESLGGGLTSDPAVMVLGGAAFVFARGTDGAIYWQWIRSSTNRSGWQRLDLPGP